MTDDVAAAEDGREPETTFERRVFDLRVREETHRHGRALARIWAPVVAAVFLGFLALIGFIVYQVSGEHAAEHRAKLDQQSRQVTVWCYADPHSDRGTSTVTGTLDQVRGFCPDQQQPTYDPGGNP